MHYPTLAIVLFWLVVISPAVNRDPVAAHLHSAEHAYQSTMKVHDERLAESR
jgi:hypothetical protein